MGKDLKGKELGEGLCQIKDGRYLGRYTDMHGKRRVIYGKKLKEVKEKLNKATYTNKMGCGKIDSKNMTVNELYELWFRYKSTIVKKSTLGNYERLFYSHILPKIGNVKITAVDRHSMQKLFDELHQTISSATINNYKAAVRNMFEYAMQKEYLLQNPCDKITIKNTQEEVEKASKKKENKYLSEEQVRKLLAFAEKKKRKNIDLYKLILLTGIRIGEALCLQWKDVDFERKTLNITKTFSRVQSRNIREISYNQLPKSKNSIRKIPLCDNAVDVLRLHKKSRYTSDTFIFTKGNGSPYLTENPTRTLKVLIKDYNTTEIKLAESEGRTPQLIPENTLHALRHTFASRCFENEIVPKVVQNYLGHSTINMTMDIYTHVSEQKKRENIDKINFTV